MATAAAAPTAEEAAPKKKRKLPLIIAIVVVVLLAAGGAAVVIAKKSGAHQDEAAQASPPTFQSLDVFTVNLADRDRERFLQTNIALEVRDAKAAERVKAFNPIVRSHVLMILSSQTADQIVTVEGKQRVAAAIVDEINKVVAGNSPDLAPEELPVVAAHFSTFVVQ